MTAQRRAAVRDLLAQGFDEARIAEQLHVSTRTVQRDRHALGLSHHQRWVWTADQLWLARNLLEDGATYAEVARTIGCTWRVVRGKLPGYGHMGNPLGNGRHMKLAQAFGLGLRT